MKRFLLARPVTEASGTQTFWADAVDEQDALARHENGEGGMYASDCEVDQLGEAEICGEIDTTDFGDFPPAN